MLQRHVCKDLVPAFIALRQPCALFASDASPSPSSSDTKSQPVDELSKASPTGRLLDLFAPEQVSTSQRQGKPQPLLRPRAEERRQVAQETEGDMIRVILQAVENCKPLVKVQSINTGARIVHVPRPVTTAEQESLAVRWIVAAAHKRHDKAKHIPIAECLAEELLSAFRKEGPAREKRNDLHRLALENKSNVGGYRLK